MGSNQNSNRTVVDQIIDLARKLLGFPPKPVLVPVAIRHGRPTQQHRDRTR